MLNPFPLQTWPGVTFSSSSELRRVCSQEPAPAGSLPGGAAEVGEPTGQEDSQEAPPSRAVCTLLPPRVHEGSGQPVHEEAQQTAAHHQEQVAEVSTHLGGQTPSCTSL